MDLTALTPIIVVLILGAMSPGPSLVVLLRNTVEGGKSRGVACGFGHGIGFGIYALIAVTGIAQLKASASNAAGALEIVGGLFLLVLAALMFRSSENEEKKRKKRKLAAKDFPFMLGLKPLAPLPLIKLQDIK